MIGDLQAAALISREGSLDWLCWPIFSSPACFAALLGDEKNGYWSIRPTGDLRECRRRYRGDTMILETTMVTDSGELLLTDLMPVRGRYSDVIRRVRCVRGEVPVRMDLVIRFDYGLTIPWVTMRESMLHAIAGPNMVVLRCMCVRAEAVTLHGQDMTTVSEFTLREGEEVCFTLTYAGSNEEIPPPIEVDKEESATEKFWTEWATHSLYKGPYRDPVMRGLIVLKSLTYAPTAGMVAAPTAGLPEELGGERNWDYRYCWLRDAAFTLLVLMRAGFTEEAVGWRLWLLRAIAGAPDQLQTLYGVNGERHLTEWNVSWLPGYENSAPVRIGNAASEQFQLDVFGEVSAALNRTPDAEDDLRAPADRLQAALVDHVCKIWQEPDQGIWESRGERKQYVHSKVMAWVALDRAIRDHERYDGKGDLERWRKNRDMLHAEICEKGFDKELNSFTQTYGSKSLDASNLRLLMVGFLPADDPRMIGTVEAVQKNLTRDGLVLRYRTEDGSDGLSGSEGTFLACSFWLVIALQVIGRSDEATAYFERLLRLPNDIGLLSEEYSPKSGRMLGNFPQALSHLALVHAAMALSGQWSPVEYQAPTT